MINFGNLLKKEVRKLNVVSLFIILLTFYILHS